MMDLKTASFPERKENDCAHYSLCIRINDGLVTLLVFTFLNRQGDGFADEVGVTFSGRDFLHELCDHDTRDLRALFNSHCRGK